MRVTRPTSPSAVTTGSLTRTPFSRPGRDHDRLRERAGGPADHLGRDRLEVAREARPVDVVLQRAQVVVLLQRELALDRPLAQLPVLDAQALGLGAGRRAGCRPTRTRRGTAARGARSRPRTGFRTVAPAEWTPLSWPSSPERKDSVMRISESSTRQPTASRRRSGPPPREPSVVVGVRRTVTPSAADRALRPLGTTAECSEMPGRNLRTPPRTVTETPGLRLLWIDRHSIDTLRPVRSWTCARVRPCLACNRRFGGEIGQKAGLARTCRNGRVCE